MRVEAGNQPSEAVEVDNPFSPQETRLLQGLIEGLANDVLARRLGVGHNRVKNLKHLIVGKVDKEGSSLIEELTKAVIFGVCNGLLNTDHLSETLQGRLTDREEEIVVLMVRGIGTIEIANSLGISKNTTINHRQSIFEKFTAHTHYMVVAKAMKMAMGQNRGSKSR